MDCDINTMEQSFEQSQTVFVAQILSSELIDTVQFDGVRKHRPMVRHYFKLMEVFKGEVTYDAFDSELVWNEDVAHFAVGDVNLFFMGPDPGFNSCQPRYLLGQPDTMYVLKKLRSLKEGEIQSMSGSWVANTTEARCSLYTTYVLENLNGAVSMSLGHNKATDARASGVGVWVYSQSSTGQNVVGADGFLLSFSESEISVPQSGMPDENSANFFTRSHVVGALLTALLAGREVQLEGVTRNDQAVEILVLLNGGQTAIEQFAQCSDLPLRASAPIP